MKTKKGSTYTTLLNVKVEQGTLYTGFTVPMSLGDIDAGYIAEMIPAVNDRIITDKKPGATFEKCLESIDLQRARLTAAYVELFEAYQRMLHPATTRTSSADKARYDMLSMMKDKMLRTYAEDFIGGDKASEYLLPDDREQLIADVITAMKAGKE